MTRHADVSAARVNWVLETLFPLPAGAVWVENTAYDAAHSRCRELGMADQEGLYLKGQPATPGLTARQLRRQGLAGVWRCRKEVMPHS